MKTKKIVKGILIGLITAMFLFSAYGKLRGDMTAVMMLEQLNLGAYRVALGIIDIIIALSLLCKRTRRVGIAVGTGYLGGAIASDLALGGMGVVPGVLMLMLWVIARLDTQLHCTCNKETSGTEKCLCTPTCTCDKGKCTC